MLKINNLLTRLTLLSTIVLISGCATTMPIAQESGKADAAYLLISSSGKNVNKPVIVTIDNITSFEAKPIKRKHITEKGISYQIKPGKRHVKITRQNTSLYEGTVFINQQETKIIQIP